MRFIVVAICVVASCVSTEAWAQNCKPDVAREDKISKQRIDIWVQELFATSFGASLMSTSEVGITATVGRYGDLNVINLQIRKKEESATNAAFEMAYRAAQGNPFYFGFTAGEPVALVVTDVTNAANIQQGLFSAKGVTTVVLSAVLSDEEMAGLRQALTSRQIDAVRIRLAGDQQIDKSVSDKNGRKMMEKFTCFYGALDKRGIDLNAAGNSAPGAGTNSAELARFSGRYLGTGGNYLDLKQDGTLSLHQDGKDFTGKTVSVRGDVLTLRLSHMRTSNTVRLVDGNLLEVGREVWARESDAPKEDAPQLTIDHIIQMVTVSLPDDIIITTIQKSSSKFDLTLENLIKLKTAGVSDAVIRAMTR